MLHRGSDSPETQPKLVRLLRAVKGIPTLATPQFFRSRQGAVPGGGRLTGARWSGGWAMRAVGQLSAGRGERERHAPLAGGTAPSVQGKSARPATRRQGRRLAAQRVGAM